MGALVPLTFVDSIRRRMSSLGEVGQEVLRTAAVLGRHFDWTLLPMATHLDERTVLTSLRRAVEAQLVLAGGRDSFRFRHSLTRDAVLSDLLPGERTALARRVLSAV